MNTETIEQSANVIWGLARDLAQQQPSGMALNSERNVRYIASLLEAYAVRHAEASIVVLEVQKTAGHAERVRQLMAELKALKIALSQVEKGNVAKITRRKAVLSVGKPRVADVPALAEVGGT